jgi:hypothetical protein
MRVVNLLTWFRDEFRRENLEARERRADRSSKQVERPVLYAAFVAVFWGSGMWLLDGRQTDFGSLLGLALGSLLFGLGNLWWTRRWNRKQRTANGSASSEVPAQGAG